MREVTGWFFKGISFDEAPASISGLEACSNKVSLTKDELLKSSKWEPLLQGKRQEITPGWTPLESLAKFRRGIATGANGFFLLPLERLLELGIDPKRCFPCVGRASDVSGLIYRKHEHDAAVSAGGKLFLLNLTAPLSEAEMRYVNHGEEIGLTARFLLANRRPWYSMEQREVSPIWAAVFGRGDLKFVFNEAGVRSLTNFHCIYPSVADPKFHKALTLSLNADIVREASKLHGRVYGGGLNKFEPNDLKAIQVPDLRLVDQSCLAAMATALDALNENPDNTAARRQADDLCAHAAKIASGN